MVAVLPDRGTVEAMPEIEANANLIAAAPDMYEALECACDKYCIGYAGDSLVKCEDCVILKALRKARGEAGMTHTELGYKGRGKRMANKQRMEPCFLPNRDFRIHLKSLMLSDGVTVAQFFLRSRSA